MQRIQCEEIYRRSRQVIPGGVNSPVRAFTGLDETPLIVESGSRDTIIDSDGFTYIDYCCSWGALIHGHAHPQIVAAAQKRVAQGSSFGIATQVELKCAEAIVSSLPSIKKIRFVSSGTEATMSALRLARAFTGRDLLVKFSGHYHGHADSFLVRAGSGVTNLSPTSSSAGVPQDFIKHTISLTFNDFEEFRTFFKEHGQKVAAVIVEPIAANMGLVSPKDGFLEMVREETIKSRSLLIFDEVITGFRVGRGGAQGLFGIEPDLTCLGKIIGGGFPAAAFGGREEIMDRLAPQGNVYQAGTLSGNPVAMEAGFRAMHLCSQNKFYEELEAKTNLVTQPIRQYIQEHDLALSLQQVGSLFTIFFGKKIVENFDDARECDPNAFSSFFKVLLKKGIYFSPSQQEVNFVSSAHTRENLEYTGECVVEYLEAIRKPMTVTGSLFL